MIDEAVKNGPSTIRLFDGSKNPVVKLGGDNFCLDLGSAALNILEPGTNAIRPALTPDFVAFSKVVEQLDYIKAQSTALIYGDVPQNMADR